jgi:hypothetical protein
MTSMFILSTSIKNRFVQFFTAHHRPYRMAALVTLAALIGWTISYSIQSSHHSERLISVVDQYGKNISLLVSDQLAHSVSQADSISTQATAQNIARKAAVSSIVVYNNNNQILAQVSGRNTPKHSALKEYTSPILSGENIIGSTAVVIDTHSFNATSQAASDLWWAAGLILLSIIFSIKDILTVHRNSDISGETGSNGAKVKEDARRRAGSSHTDIIPTGVEKSKDNTDVIYVIITIHNIDTLNKQLNSELRQQQMLLLDKNIAHAVSLYGGKILVVGNNEIIFIFEKKNIENAIYSLQLLLALHKKNKNALITMDGVIMETTTEKGPSSVFIPLKLLANNKKPYGSYIQSSLIDKYTLETYLEYKKDASSFTTTVNGLQPHYQKLLDNQLTHLLNNEI